MERSKEDDDNDIMLPRFDNEESRLRPLEHEPGLRTRFFLDPVEEMPRLS